MMMLIEERKAADRFGGFSCMYDHFAFKSLASAGSAILA